MLDQITDNGDATELSQLLELEDSNTIIISADMIDNAGSFLDYAPDNWPGIIQALAYRTETEGRPNTFYVTVGTTAGTAWFFSSFRLQWLNTATTSAKKHKARALKG